MSWLSCPRWVNISCRNTPSMHNTRSQNVTFCVVAKQSHVQNSHLYCMQGNAEEKQKLVKLSLAFNCFGGRVARCPPQDKQTWVQTLLSTWGLFLVESNQWLQNWYSSSYPHRHLALQDQCWGWLAHCQYNVTGWDSKLDLQLLSRSGSMNNFLSSCIP